MNAPTFRSEPGWFGMFTRDEAPGAFPNGTRVFKSQSEPGDSHPTGTMGTILGSMAAPDIPKIYFVEWDPNPRVAIAVVETKIEKIQSN